MNIQIQRTLTALFTGLAFPAFSQIVINEIHYDPDIKTEQVEFIELYNSGTSEQDLSGGYLSDAVDFTFPKAPPFPPGAIWSSRRIRPHFTPNSERQQQAHGSEN